ncbi:uncharacterized protein TM35_000084330 [Trypanosoma theileri]|uniref:Mucin-like glycoprotein n=1 Tax=Trypanosoma theileri TaxID=67003 RepID=A0A1X0P157_9TRYP|nr:uncharacterized protein TM35_000084330 [Trypanosoma theileri]ORC90635.1 hypothetical protein TM35_000084330 [Trypanosoma theileri]
MMMMMRRVMCVLAVVLCCACGYTMTAAAADGQPKVVITSDMVKEAHDISWDQFPAVTSKEKEEDAKYRKCRDDPNHEVQGINCSFWKEFRKVVPSQANSINPQVPQTQQHQGSLSREGEEHAQDVPAGRETPASGASPENGAGAVPQSGVDAESAPEKSSTSSKPPSSPTAPAEGSTTSTASANENTGNPQSPATVGATLTSDSQETTSTTPPNTENTLSEAPTTTPFPEPVTDTQISSIAPTVQMKANVDSSISPVWMRTAVPLLMVAVLFSVTLY